ncbi:hypothetical protein [Bacillus benzoevorans]|uniref:Uncharacterized protein n=1 Tax=Bacillus benzoevorans TaxID=1456 RepID=A0A7X0HPJ1_9BACI|nr:hypothetical protein [Bacillus benzoevorans]MBB6444331.1 hypothetical protein [Bacillus benzoevorans]
MSRRRRVIIEDELLEHFDFEGVLIHTLEPQTGMLVMSSKDDTFTLHIFQMKLNHTFEYHVTNELTAKSFPTLSHMQYFLTSFSTIKDYEFMDFLKRHNDEME